MGRPETILDMLDESTRKRVDEALLSRACENVKDVYRDFGLATRGVTERGFYAYAKRLRERFSPEDSPSPQPSPFKGEGARARSMETLDRLIGLLNERLDAGDPKHLPGIATAVRAMTDCMRLSLDEEAEKRAAELHKIKLDQLSKTLRKDVDEKTANGTRTLSREDVHDMIDAIMRGE